MERDEAERILEHMARACKVREQSLEEMLNNFEESAYNYARALREVISQAEEALKYQDLDPRETGGETDGNIQGSLPRDKERHGFVGKTEQAAILDRLRRG